jgi:hypothetical protein
MKLGALLAGVSTLLIVVVGPCAYAAAACTGWTHLAVAGYKDTNLEDDQARAACVREVEAQTRQAGYASEVNADTLFFWFGRDVVTARCMSRTLVALSSFDNGTDDACPLLNRIRDHLRHQK